LSSSLAGRTIEAARREVAARLKSADIDSAELDARLLVGAALGVDLTGMISAARRPLTTGEAGRLDELISRRLAREPVARILGQKEFWSLPLKLSAETLVPRPATETVVELALELSREAQHQGRALKILDIGTGSGAILLALLTELSGAIGVGTDISLAALQTARRNAIDLELAKRALFIKCNYAVALSGPFDLIVSNPPYIPSQDILKLDPEVRDHDPHRALDGGADGLDAYRTLIPQAVRLLVAGGALVIEAGQGQISSITGLMRAAGLTMMPEPRADLGGTLRAVGCRKLPP
jgi:release factor glutamine methyltransferase